MPKSIPLVLRLQQDLLDQTSSVGSLLRLAKVVATKLSLAEALFWIDRELDGYMTLMLEDLPKYRVVRGTPQGWDPSSGWRTIFFQNAEHLERYSTAPIGMPLPAIEESLRDRHGGHFAFPYQADVQVMLRKAIGQTIDLQIELSYEQVWSIVDAVRNLLLKWSLDLEKAGVVGIEMTFTREEQKSAGAVTQQFFIQNAGVVGTVADRANVYNEQTASMNINIDKVGEFLDQARAAAPLLPDEINKALAPILRDLSLAVAERAPDQSKIRGLLSSIRRVCESAAGNLAARGIVALLASLFS